MSPLSIRNDATSGTLHIEWQEGAFQRLAHGDLRNRCRCSHCSAKHALQRDFSFPDTRVTDIRPVGAYGIQLIFADGHERGIFPWDYLKSMD